MDAVALEIPECPPGEVAALRSALAVSEPLAQVLVCRGLGAPESARAFLAAADCHPPEAFTGIERALEPILTHVRERRRITVHGDYDVDGVCATAILVGAARHRRRLLRRSAAREAPHPRSARRVAPLEPAYEAL